MAREQKKPKPTTGKAELFPRRAGNRVVQDRPLTPAEAAAYGEDQRAMQRARQFRQRKRREAPNGS